MLLLLLLLLMRARVNRTGRRALHQIAFGMHRRAPSKQAEMVCSHSAGRRPLARARRSPPHHHSRRAARAC